MIVAVSLLSWHNNVLAQGKFTFLGANVGGFQSKGISGNIVLGSTQNQSALFNDISQTTVVLNIPSSSYASGLYGSSVVGTYEDSTGNERGYLYNTSTGTYITLDDPSAVLNTGSPNSNYYGTELTGIYGNIIVGNIYSGGNINSEIGVEYNISTQTWTTIGGDIVGIYGNNILGSEIGGNGYQGFIYNYINSTSTTFTVPGSITTAVNGIFGNEVAGGYNAGSGSMGDIYNIGNNSFSYPFTLSQLDKVISPYIASGYGLDGISGSSLLVTVFPLGGGDDTFVYTVPEISCMWLLMVPFVGLLLCRLRRADHSS